jgi:hypothetical protein
MRGHDASKQFALRLVRRKPPKNLAAPKRAAAGFWSSRCHETPLKASRGIKTVTAQPRYEYEVRAHHVFFYFVGLAAILSFLV